MNLTNLQLERLAASLGALDGIRTKPDEFQPYRFDADTTWLIAANTVAVAEKLSVFNRAKKLLMVSHQMVDRVTVTPENVEKVQAFMAAVSELEDREVKADGIQQISRCKLAIGGDSRKGENLIPSSVLAGLMPILTEG